VTPVGAAIAYYEPENEETSDGVIVHAGLPVSGEPSSSEFAVVDLPGIESAATVIHRGRMDDVMQSLHGLAEWIEANGYRPVGYHREVYLDYCASEPDSGVTELQVAVVAA
jgi:effector-binding domain-containing protein